MENVLAAGERRLNLLRAFNYREGLTSNDDNLPPKMYKALTGGASDGVHLTMEELEQAKSDYYEMAGWDQVSGAPTRSKLDDLGFAWVADLVGL